MSMPDPHSEMTHGRQHEIAARAIHPQHVNESRATADRTRHSVRARARQAVAVLGVCLAVTTTAAVDGACAGQGAAQASSRVSAQQLNHEIRALEARGYVQWQCTTRGTLMRNPRTGRLVTLRW
jgi:anti-sigma factor RsiW